VSGCAGSGRAWVTHAIGALRADALDSPTPPLCRFPLPAEWGIDLFLLDESVHPTGSLKHRLSRSLFLHGLCDGSITAGMSIVEASSGSTAVSEAYHARLLGLPFVAVMPAGTSSSKLNLIAAQGGSYHLVPTAADVVPTAHRLAQERGGRFLDQFANAELVTDWRGADSIAAALLARLAVEGRGDPQWIVVGAGTGGTATTIGRLLRYRQLGTRLCVVDPENSVYYPCWRHGDRGVTSPAGSRIEGIGRPAVAPSFRPALVDLVLPVPDAGSLAAMALTATVLGRPVGPSTGTNVWGALRLIARLRQRGRRGTVATLICDGGERYESTYYEPAWLSAHGLNPAPHHTALATFLAGAAWDDPRSSSLTRHTRRWAGEPHPSSLA
jgi:cysteine synthase A